MTSKSDAQPPEVRSGVIAKALMANVGLFGGERRMASEFEFQRPLVIVRGNNAKGKTTLSWALRALASDSEDPRDLGSRRLSDYAGDAKISPKASLSYYDGTDAVWEIGKGSRRSAPVTPRLVSGIDQPLMLRGKAAGEFWGKIFSASLSIDMIRDSFGKALTDLPPGIAEEASMAGIGWIERWERMSGEINWSQQFLAVQEEYKQCQGAVNRALGNARLRSARKIIAAVQEELGGIPENLKAAIGDLDKTKAELQETLQKAERARVAKEDLKQIKKSISDYRGDIADFQRLADQEIKKQEANPGRRAMYCPRCRIGLRIVDGVLELAHEGGEASKYIAKVDRAKNLLTASEDALKSQKAKMKEMESVDEEGIKAKFEEIEAKVRSLRDDEDRRTELTAALGKARAGIGLEALAELISDGANGLRAKLRRKGVELLQSRIDMLYTHAGSPLSKVTLNPDTFEFNIGSRAAAMASSAEQWLAGAVIQLAALTMRRNTPMVCVIDGADILSANNAFGFWKMAAAVCERHGDCTMVITATDFNHKGKDTAIVNEINKNLIQYVDLK